MGPALWRETVAAGDSRIEHPTHGALDGTPSGQPASLTIRKPQTTGDETGTLTPFDTATKSCASR